jgi:hypothetical protein
MYTLVSEWNFLRDIFNGYFYVYRKQSVVIDTEKTGLCLFDAQKELCKKDVRINFS